MLVQVRTYIIHSRVYYINNSVYYRVFLKTMLFLFPSHFPNWLESRMISCIHVHVNQSVALLPYCNCNTILWDLPRKCVHMATLITTIFVNTDKLFLNCVYTYMYTNQWHHVHMCNIYDIQGSMWLYRSAYIHVYINTCTPIDLPIQHYHHALFFLSLSRTSSMPCVHRRNLPLYQLSDHSLLYVTVRREALYATPSASQGTRLTNSTSWKCLSTQETTVPVWGNIRELLETTTSSRYCTSNNNYLLMSYVYNVFVTVSNIHSYTSSCMQYHDELFFCWTVTCSSNTHYCM